MLKTAGSAVCLALILLTGLGHRAGADGSVSTTNATIASGAAPTQGAVTIDACAPKASAPAPLALAPLGTIGTMTGTLPAFPGGGTGADGAFHATASQALAGGTYNYTSYLVDNGVTVTYSGPVTILATGAVTVQGQVVTTTADSPVTIRCAGEFVVDGSPAIAQVKTSAAFSSVTIDAARNVNAGALDGVAADVGNVTVTAYGVAAGTGDVNVAGGFIEDSRSVGNAAGTVTIRAARGMHVTADGRAGSINDAFVVQAFGGDVTVSGTGSYLNAKDGSLTIEASAGVTLDNSAYVNTSNGPMSVTAFGGDITVSGGYFNTLDSNLTLRASGSLLFRIAGSYLNSRLGNVALTAFGGDVGFDNSEARLNTQGSASIAAMGDVRCQDRVDSSVGISIQAHGGTISFTGGGYIEVRDAGTIDLRAATRIEMQRGPAGRGYIDAGTGAGGIVLSAGPGGIDLDVRQVVASAGGISFVTSGPLTVRSDGEDTARIQAPGSITLTSATGGIDVSDATLSTDNQAASSGSILIESFGGPAGAIDAGRATIRSGTSNAASGSVTLRVHEADAVPAIESFILPKTLKAKVNTKDATKSLLFSSGFFDSGPGVANLASAASLDIGGFHVDVPGLVLKGKVFTLTSGTTTFSITPNAFGSSRAKFRLKTIGDFTGNVATEGPIALRFKDAVSDGGGTVRLTRGFYGLGKVRGALVAPNLYLARARATLKGAGKDALAIVVGLATGGTTPATASPVTVGFGGMAPVTIPAGSFVKKGDQYVFKGNVSGVTSVVVDYRRETIRIAGKALTLGTFAQGGNPVLISVGLGADSRAVRVRMGRKGGTMKY